MRKILILGGTGEANRLAAALAERGDVAVETALAGRTRAPERPAGQVRIGGFGGAEGLARYLEDQAIDLLVDATHPFAQAISANAVGACALRPTPRLALVRPEWAPGPADRWIAVPSLEVAAGALLPGIAVFLAVGRQGLGAFAERPDLKAVVRLVDPPDGPLPLPDAELVVGRGPFTVEDEVVLLKRYAIEWMVARNSGGAASFAKLEAARLLHVPVLLVRRPAPPPGDRVATVAEALDWLAERI